MNRYLEAPVYRPLPAPIHQTKGRYFVPVIGPTESGKSALCQEIALTGGPNYGQILSNFTRKRRPEERDLPILTGSEDFTQEKAWESIFSGETIVHTSHATTGNVYTADANNLTLFNFMPMTPDGLPLVQNAGFEDVYPIVLVQELHDYIAQLGSRVYQDDSELEKRLIESADSLEWAIANAALVSFVVNRRNRLEETAATIRSSLSLHQSQKDRNQGVRHAVGMLSYINDILTR